MGANARNPVIGIDLNRIQPQICYYVKATDSTVTAPMKIGNEEVSFEDIFEQLDEIEDDPNGEDVQERLHELGRQAASIFSQALSTLGLDDPEKQTAGMVITVPRLTKPLVTVIRTIYSVLGIDRSRAYLQDYKESFYYHTLYQDKELWNRNVGFFRFEGDQVSFLSLSMNHQTRPVTVTATDGVSITLREDKSQWDEQFYNMINASLRQNIYSCIFLQGEPFDKSWAGRSIALLCKGGRKVYVVDNLYARGACYAARERAGEKRLSDYLYLGDDLIRNNIGMKMFIQGKETFYPLIAAGVNWYEADKSCECILEGDPELEFLISGMESVRQSITKMTLQGLEIGQRPAGTTRLGLHLSYESPTRCVIEVEDLGFGELFPSDGMRWREVLEG